MTERIQLLKKLQWDGFHHAARISVAEGIENEYRNAGLKDFMRTAVRMEMALKLETPFLFPGELIAFTRTVPGLPMIYSEEEWREISSSHYIHELGSVSNLSADYGKVIRSGLNSILNDLGGSEYELAVKRSVQALLDLTAKYAEAARGQGMTDLACILEKVPTRL